MQTNVIRVVKNSIIILFTIILISSCSVDNLKPSEYLEWANSSNNGLVLNKEIKGFDFSLSYRTPEYLAIQEYGVSDLASIKSRLQEKEKNDLLIFDFKIKAIGKNEEAIKVDVTQEEYIARVDYLSFLAQNDFTLIAGKDTLPCVLYHFERQYSLASHNDIVLGFKPKDNKEHKDLTLCYDDKIFGNGVLYFTISKDNLVKIPKLIL